MRAAMTETCNAYATMPASVHELAQLAGRLDAVREANLEHHARLVAEAVRQGARVVGLGELFAAPYFALERRELWRGLAEDAVEGPSVAFMRQVAREHAVVLVVPIYELDRATQRRFNTAVVIERDGRVLGRYRKTHIPQGSNDKGSFDERFYYGPGEPAPNDPAHLASANPHFPVFKTSAGNIGVAICYDRHFEGVIAALKHGGAELVFSPAVTFGSKSERMWELEFLVDAARHRVFIGGSNRKGSEAPWNQPYFGNSYFAGPDGDKLRNVSAHHNLIMSDLDLAALQRPDPSGWNLQRDRRSNIY